MQHKNIFLSYLIILLLTYATEIFAANINNESKIRDSYQAMDKALYTNNQEDALKYYNNIISFGSEAASILNDLVTSVPLTQKTYKGVCSIWKQIGDKAIGLQGLRYLLRSPVTDDFVKLKCLRILDVWEDNTIASDAETLFDDKQRNVNLRVVAANILRKLDPQKAKTKLMEKLDDNNEEMLIHYKVIQYLESYNDQKIDKELKKYMLNNSQGFELAKERALISLYTRDGIEVVDLLSEVLSSTNTPKSLKSRSINYLSNPNILQNKGKSVLYNFINSSDDSILKDKARKAMKIQIPMTQPQENIKYTDGPEVQTE